MAKAPIEQGPNVEVRTESAPESRINENVISDPSQAINELASALLAETENIRRQIDSSQIQQSIAELKRNTELFRAMSTAALTGGMQTAAPYNPNIAANAPTTQSRGCGCAGTAAGGNCGPDTKTTCCVELYISAIEVISGQSLPELGDKDELELMVAVQAAGQSWGLFPGLNSSVQVSKAAGAVAANAPIGRFCVPCSECRTIPLVAQAHEVEEMVSGGRAEYGSNPGFITIRCDCDVAPVKIVVSMDGGGITGGIVSIQVSARFVGGSCCGY